MFKPILNDAEEIVNFIRDFADDSIDFELVKEYFRDCSGILKTVSISNLEEGNKNNNIRAPKKERVYETLPIETMPPLIVEGGIVLDGNHRLRAAKKRGLKQILIYEIV